MWELFDKTEEKNGRKVKAAYLTHGVAESKWAKRGRREALEKFISDDCWKDEYRGIIARALINLASEMAKQCKCK